MTGPVAPGVPRRGVRGIDPGEAAAREAAPAPPGAPFWSPQPVIGFRAWALTPEGMRGVVQVWPGPRLEAACPRGGESPHWGPGCRCGIYALKWARRVGLMRMTCPPPLVYGAVALSGRVIEHENGYRGQQALVFALVLVHHGRLVCCSDPGWVGRMFAPGSGDAAAAGVPGMPVAGRGLPVPGAEYLEEEARRFRRLWT